MLRLPGAPFSGSGAIIAIAIARWARVMCRRAGRPSKKSSGQHIPEDELGPPTSLNMIVAIVCGSGIGKSKACRVAARAMPLPADCLDMLPIGTGEGLAEVFMGDLPSPSDKGEKRGQVRHNAHFFVDEGELLLNLFERRGATIGETIRRMFTDAPLGQTNAHPDTRRRVVDYSLVITVATTFAPAGRILAMSESGTAQRFLWAYGIDAAADPKPGAPAPVFPSMPWSDITLNTGLQNEVTAIALARLHGKDEYADENAHEPLIRSRLAAILAIWDDRTLVVEDDWALAGEIFRSSCAVPGYGDRCRRLDRDGARIGTRCRLCQPRRAVGPRNQRCRQARPEHRRAAGPQGSQGGHGETTDAGPVSERRRAQLHQACHRTCRLARVDSARRRRLHRRASMPVKRCWTVGRCWMRRLVSPRASVKRRASGIEDIIISMR